MITLALQIFLLLLSAYLVGCMVGCFLRRALYTPQTVEAIPVDVAGVEAKPLRRGPSADTARFEAALRGKPNQSQPAVPLGEPVVEVRPRPGPVPQPERPVRETGTAQIEIIKAPLAPPPPEIVPEPPAPVARAPETPPIITSAQTDAPVVEPPIVTAVQREQPTPYMSGAAQVASYAAVAAAAAAARAAAEAEAAARAPEPEPESEPQPTASEPDLEPNVETAPTPASDSAAAVETSSSVVADRELDVQAEPEPEAVAVVEARVAEPAPVSTTVEAVEPVVVVPELDEVAPSQTLPQTLPSDDLKRIRGIDQSLQDRLISHGVRRFSDIAAWSSDDVARMSQTLGLVGRIEQENWIEQADILARGGNTDYAPRQSGTVAPAAVGMAAAAASAAANATAQKSAGPDRFTRIIGIDPDTEKALYALGVTRYSDIAQWSSADVERVEGTLGRPGRVGLDNWIEQARVLSRYGGDMVEARPARLADAIRENRAPRPSEPASGRTDVAGLRSVRSQALRGEGPAPGERMDDLKRIRGIGVLIEKRLNALGITSYEQVANWTKADSDNISTQLDFRGRIERENWIEQARILASGGQTEFSRRVDRGEVESSKDS